MYPNKSVVHCVKDPCHSIIVGTRKLPKDHRNYLAAEFPRDLFLNMIDPPQPLFQPGTFERFMKFMREHSNDKAILIHCNKGGSRAPSLAMLWLAKGLHVIGDESYDVAVEEFEPLYFAADEGETLFKPGEGIQTYMREHWEEL